jgi:hypothetical protein
MFDLEKAIAVWRLRMKSAGVQAPVPLDELESHLREEIERQIQAGASQQRALLSAIMIVGQPEALRNEFKKGEQKYMKRSLYIGGAVFGTLFGEALILPALARWVHTGHVDSWPLAVGLLMVLVSIVVAFQIVRNHCRTLKRGLVTGFLLVAGIFNLVPLIQAAFLKAVSPTDWMACGGLAAVSVLVFGGCLFMMWRRQPALEA